MVVHFALLDARDSPTRNPADRLPDNPVVEGERDEGENHHDKATHGESMSFGSLICVPDLLEQSDKLPEH